MQEHRSVGIFFLILFLVVLYFVFRIFQPFLLPISLAAVLATLCYPVFDWTCRRLRNKRSWAALLTCVWVTASIIIPFVILLILLTGEVTEVYQQFQRRLESGDWQVFLTLQDKPYIRPFAEWLRQNVDLGEIDLIGSLGAALQQVSLFFLRQSTAILSGLFRVTVDFLIMLVCMFFLFRDGNRLMEVLKTWIPLSENFNRVIFKKFQEVSSATVIGTLLTALAQGVAGGLLYWLIGIPNALLWGCLTALFSLLPVVGTGIVWVPWAIFFFLTGSWIQGIILVVGGLLVGMLDNVLKAILIEGRAEMHTLIVFLAIMGGIGYFGIVGMIFGPIIVALALTFLELYKMEFQLEVTGPKEE
ncbi:MAG: AI-2E family transporter [Acidobacteria bacterium]|nr:AI-2E family transporter [Acidobacteriota bacterium]